jgi:hypothetical protein
MKSDELESLAVHPEGLALRRLISNSAVLGHLLQVTRIRELNWLNIFKSRRIARDRLLGMYIYATMFPARSHKCSAPVAN